MGRCFHPGCLLIPLGRIDGRVSSVFFEELSVTSISRGDTLYSVKPCLLPPCKVQWRDLVVVIDMDMVVDMDVVMGAVVVSLTVGASRKLWESWHHLHEIQRTGLSWNMM